LSRLTRFFSDSFSCLSLERRALTNSDILSIGRKYRKQGIFDIGLPLRDALT
jgi:hypothetical protein